ncbi:MAG: AAA family ATPase [Treponema sp.]|jgi:MoxR-like ATPase|nr:AAA family ATPase [Treponema sp.]
MNSIKTKIQKLLRCLTLGIYEKDAALYLALLSSIAGESIFLLGPPGIAKSLVARRLKYAYKNARGFEYLMSRFSTPDELFGPVKISELKNNDKYERNINNYLPSATIVFLDEIWKAGPSIQNALLTVINEKIFRNGEFEIKVPMKALVSASNELPSKNDGLEALWDRFLVRLVVGNIQDKQMFHEMTEMSCVTEPEIDEEDKIADDDYLDWSLRIDQINIPQNIRYVIDVIRNFIDDYNKNTNDDIRSAMYVSDRRWRKIVRLMRTAAFLNDRKEVDLMDCFLIRHCIWHDETQIKPASAMVQNAVEKYGYSAVFDFNFFDKTFELFREEIEKETVYVKDEQFNILYIPIAGYYEIENPPNQNMKLLLQYDYHRLTDSYQNIGISYKNPAYNDVNSSGLYNIRKGNSPFGIIINDTEFRLRTVTHGRLYRKIKKPSPDIEKEWDRRVTSFLDMLQNAKVKIEECKRKDAPYLRKNLFVEPEYAAAVEAHIPNILKEIEKKELDITLAQNTYKKIKSEETVFDDG